MERVAMGGWNVGARFFQRAYPSANSVVLPGGILVDPGCGSAVAGLRAWLGGARVGLVVNTHWHSDHAGAIAALQAEGVLVAGPAGEAVRIAAGDGDVGRAAWLGQYWNPYRVDFGLEAGDGLDAWGGDGWVVMGLPGHTATQIGLWHAGERVLVCADALAERDVGWVDVMADGGALAQSEATIEAIAGLGARVVLPGHGPVVVDVDGAVGLARRRLRSWRAEPERMGWHACKRIFAHTLILEGGVAVDAVEGVLVGYPWFGDYARGVFGVVPGVFAGMLVAEMVRSGAARVVGWRLVGGV